MYRTIFIVVFGAISWSVNASDFTQVVHSYFSIEHTNDFNPLLRQLSNDTGYTLGSKFVYRKVNAQKDCFIDVTLNSDLFTQYMHDSTYFYEGGRKIKPQLFTELSTLSFQYNFQPKGKKHLLNLGGGIGFQNKRKPIPMLALWQQGGITGHGGYHGWIDYLPWLSNPGQENVATGKLKPMVFLSPSFKKYFILNPKEVVDDAAFLNIEGGVNLASLWSYNALFLKSEFELPVFQTQKLWKQPLKVALCGRQSIRYFIANGIQVLPQLGLILRYWRMEASYTTQWMLGKQPLTLVTYADNETIMKLRVAFRLK